MLAQRFWKHTEIFAVSMQIVAPPEAFFRVTVGPTYSVDMQPRFARIQDGPANEQNKTAHPIRRDLRRQFHSAASASPSDTSSSVEGTGVSTGPFDAVEVLLPRFGSGVADETVAVFDTVPKKFWGTLYVAVIVTDCPLFKVPRLQGNGVVQAPEFETNVNPAGVGSLTTTPVAALGPLFVTVIV